MLSSGGGGGSSSTSADFFAAFDFLAGDGDGGGDPFEEALEGAGVGGVERDDGFGDALQRAGVGAGTGGTGDEGASFDLADGVDATVEVVGRRAVGEEEDDRLPVAFLFGAAFDDFALDAVGEQAERFAHRGHAVGLQVRQLEAGEFGQRGELARAAVEGDDGEVSGFERVRVLHQRGEHDLQAVAHGFDGFAVHRAGGVNEEVNGGGVAWGFPWFCKNLFSVSARGVR